MLKWIYELSYDELKDEITKLHLPKFVTDQVFQWLYEKNNADITTWTNISKQNRAILLRKYDTRLAEVRAIEKDIEGTGKYLLRLRDGSHIEAVLIKEKNHHTMCISTQVGCALGCKFCATGRMGFKRDLTPGEILSQAVLLRKEAVSLQPPDTHKRKINIVFMGMGEPLLNYENLSKALTVITSGKGIGISPRNITVSTAGILDGIMRLEKDFPIIKISFSLNASGEEQREELMPISKKEKLSDILSYFRNTPRKHRITFEYVLLKGVNDSPQDAARVVKLLRGIPCKINLIPYNENDNMDYATPAEKEVERFSEYLHGKGHTVIVRWSKGGDIQSACGQLAVEQL